MRKYASANMMKMKNVLRAAVALCLLAAMALPTWANAPNAAALVPSGTPLSGMVIIHSSTKVGEPTRAGDVLTADVSQITPAGADFTHQWYSNGKLVGTERTYTITEADIAANAQINAEVTGVGDYRGSRYSLYYEVALGKVPLAGSISINVPVGTVVGKSLILNQSDVRSSSNSTSMFLLYSWMRDGVAIPGATRGSYTIRAEDVGRTLTASITGTGNYSGTITSPGIMIPSGPPIAPTITTVSLPNGTVGVAYNMPLTATGSEPISWGIVNSSGRLPSGMTLNSISGIISGTPVASAAGTFNITVRARNTAGETTKTFTLTVGTEQSAPVPAPAPSAAQTVNPTRSTVYVNGAATPFEAYIIGGNNFFKLRDLAFALSGTGKQFEVGYNNATRAITMASGQPYTPVGGEMALGDGSSKPASLNSAINISLDGARVDITAYLISGNNFMRLRDVMRLLDIGVGYDAATRSITIDTSLPYTEG